MAENVSKVAAGTAEMNAIASNQFDPCGALRWHFQQTRDSDRYSFYTNRWQQARSVCTESPKYAYVALKAMELQSENKRLLVVVNHSQFVSSFCSSDPDSAYRRRSSAELRRSRF